MLKKIKEKKWIKLWFFPSAYEVLRGRNIMKCILSNSLYAKEHNTTQSRPKLFIDERKAEIDNSGS